jgi:creatinine amidohydrolase
MILKELRSDQADFHGAAGHRPTAILPIGAVEQHSRHLPLGTDALIVEHIAARLESGLSTQVLLLPALSVGASDHHLMMSGTASVGSRSLADSVATMCLSVAASSGIDRFLIINGHGGNQPAERLALEQIRSCNEKIQGFAVDYWAAMFEELDRAQLDRPASMGHADLIETAILLGIHPHLVDMDRAEAGQYDDELSSYVSTTLGIPERSHNGGVGDPRGATAELGGVFLDAAVSGLKRLIVGIGNLP